MAGASLAKLNGLVGSELEKYSQQLLKPVVSEMSEGSGVDYVGFADAKSKNLEALMNAGVRPGDAYVRVDGVYEKVNPLEFHLLAATQLWVNFDNTGQVLSVTNKDPRSWKGPFKETIETAVLVYTSRGVVPAKATFRTTKAKPARIANKELAAAATAEWAKLDKAHAAVAGAFVIPGLRFFVVADIQKQTAKGSGLPQFVADGKLVLTTPEKSQELQKAFGAEGFSAKFDSVMQAYKNRVEELSSKIK